MCYGALRAAPPLPENAFAQCGGGGNDCTGPNCGDLAWPGFVCPAGFKCYRISPYYWYGGLQSGESPLPLAHYR